jgi:hypothetical protein
VSGISDGAVATGVSGENSRSRQQQGGTDKGGRVDNGEAAALDSEGDPEGAFHFCDGTCCKLMRPVEEHYMCSYCLDVELCKDCYSLLMSDKLGLNICGKDHEFLYAPPASGLCERGMIKIGDQFIKTQTWLEALKADWLNSTRT